MKKIDWIAFKEKTEKAFAHLSLQKDIWGYQIQKGTKWEAGLTPKTIEVIEEKWGFALPNEYKRMLRVINGFDQPHMAYDPDQQAIKDKDRKCYQYPIDFDKVQPLLQTIHQNMDYVQQTLEEAQLPAQKIEGFVPLYGHRALVVFEDKTRTPVISVWSQDIIIYGENLYQYWLNELQKYF